MADDLTPEQRRRNMQAIHSKDTTIELRMRKALWQRGVRYRKNYKKLVGKPDIAITKYKIAVFVILTIGMDTIGITEKMILKATVIFGLRRLKEICKEM